MAVHLVGNMWQLESAPDDSARYLFTDDVNGPVVVDPGSAAGLDLLAEELQGFEYDVEDAFYIATHGHYDHLSVTALFRSAKTGIGWRDYKTVRQADQKRMAYMLYPSAPPPQPNENLLVVEEGMEIRVGESVLRILETPGHTPGSICLDVEVENERVLVAGDTLHGGCSPLIDSDLEQWELSLERLCQIPFTKLTFGHGIKYLVDNAPDHLARARAQFGKHVIVPSHPDEHGVFRYQNPWGLPWEQVEISEATSVRRAPEGQAEPTSHTLPEAV